MQEKQKFQDKRMLTKCLICGVAQMRRSPVTSYQAQVVDNFKKTGIMSLLRIFPSENPEADKDTLTEILNSSYFCPSCTESACSVKFMLETMEKLKEKISYVREHILCQLEKTIEKVRKSNDISLKKYEKNIELVLESKFSVQIRK